MTDNQIINKIKQLKGIEPSAEWKSDLRSQLLSQMDASAGKSEVGSFNLFERMPKVDFGRMLFGQNLKFAFGVAGLSAIIIVVSAATLVLPGKGGSRLASLSSPASEKTVPSVSKESLSGEGAESDSIAVKISSDQPQEEIKDESKLLANLDGQAISGPVAIAKPVPKKAEPVLEKTNPDFKVGLMKERGYGDQMLGGFLMAGEIEE